MPTSKILPSVFAGIAFLCLCHDAYYLWIGISQPIVSWRETQTALSAYWLWREGPRLAYETPVLGYPWAIPFEFPLYHHLVAGLRWLGVPIEVGGRLVSFAFFIGTLAPLRLLLKELGFKSATYFIFAALFLSSPICILVARSVFIESSALFFSVVWLAFIARYLNHSGMTSLVIAMSAGCLATLAKSTTFPAYGFLGALLILTAGLSFWRDDKLREKFGLLALATIAGIVPLLVGYAWVNYSDWIKSANPIGIRLTSSALKTWTFGPWDQRFSAALWHDMILHRTLPDILGDGYIVAVFVAGSALANRKLGNMTIATSIAFLVPMVTFTNLYIVNPYYGMANAILCVAAVALGIACLIENGRPILASCLFAAILASQITYFHTHHVAEIVADLHRNPLVRTAELVRRNTDPDSAIIILGKDWMPGISYLSERRSLTMPGWIPRPAFDQLVDDPSSMLGGKKLGLIVWCKEASYELTPLINKFIAGRAVIAEVGDCQLLSPTR